MPQALEDTLDVLARPLVEAAGLDLVEIEVKGGGARTRIRVIVDRKGGVDVASCQQLNRSIGRAMDEHDPVSNRYTLEVTSPGTDRPLQGQRDFDRVEGRTIKAIMADGEATAEVIGDVTLAGEHAVVLTDKAGTTHELAYDQIIKATQILPW